MSASLSSDDQARIQALVATFRRIGDERMKDLGLYNPALQVEAVGFRRWDGWLAGVLVTPWFMNLLLLPCPPQTTTDGLAAGDRRRIAMPKGEIIFLAGDGEEAGPYLSHSIHSPMGPFASHEAAFTAAFAAVTPFFQEPGQDTPTGECGFGWGVNREY